MSFLTFGSNFSLIVRDCTNVSLFTLNFSLLATYLAIFSLLGRISHFRPLYQWNSRFTIEFLTFPASHTPTPAGPFRVTGQSHSHASLPNDMVSTMFLPRCIASAGHCLTCRRAKSEKFRLESEKFVQSRRKSEKSEPKVRNSIVCAGKVRNSSLKWETRVMAQS